MSIKFQVNSENYFKIDNLRRSDGVAISSVSSATASIEDSDGNALSDSDINLTVVSGDSDAYEGTFPNTVPLVDGSYYEIVLTIIADSVQLVERRGMYASESLQCTDSTLTCPDIDIQASISAIDEAINTGVKQVTVDGQTITYREVNELMAIRRRLVDKDKSGKRSKRPRVSTIKYGWG